MPDSGTSPANKVRSIRPISLRALANPFCLGELASFLSIRDAVTVPCFIEAARRSTSRHVQLVDAFCARLDAVLPWNRPAVEATTDIKVALRTAGTPIGPNDTAIAGHVMAVGAILVTNNIRVFERVPGLKLEDWVN